jgi:hypothetical protein
MDDIAASETQWPNRLHEAHICGEWISNVHFCLATRHADDLGFLPPPACRCRLAVSTQFSIILVQDSVKRALKAPSEQCIGRCNRRHEWLTSDKGLMASCAPLLQCYLWLSQVSYECASRRRTAVCGPAVQWCGAAVSNGRGYPFSSVGYFSHSFIHVASTTRRAHMSFLDQSEW